MPYVSVPNHTSGRLIACKYSLDITLTTSLRPAGRFAGNEERKMLKICAAALLATLCCIGAANAHGGGGGGAEPMPSTNFTDMPSYTPQRMTPAQLPKAKHGHRQQGFARGR
jgi:hypothetical protein